MSYKTIELAGALGSDSFDDVDSPFHVNYDDIDEDDANFFHFTTRSGNVNVDHSTSQGKDGKSGDLATGFNFVNSIVGAGIIGIPIAIKECGLFMGIFLLILVAYLVDQSVILLIDCGIQAKKTNFEGNIYVDM